MIRLAGSNGETKEFSTTITHTTSGYAVGNSSYTITHNKNKYMKRANVVALDGGGNPGAVQPTYFAYASDTGFGGFFISTTNLNQTVLNIGRPTMGAGTYNYLVELFSS
jgi:hypothetical protein